MTKQRSDRSASDWGSRTRARSCRCWPATCGARWRGCARSRRGEGREEGSMSKEPGRILLVDHSRGALLFQETILRRRDTMVMTALAGSEGLEKARLEHPSLIIFAFDLFD